MFVVDTNLLVYAANRDSPFHQRSLQLLSGWRRGASAWFLTRGICYEFLRVDPVTRSLVDAGPAPAAAIS